MFFPFKVMLPVQSTYLTLSRHAVSVINNRSVVPLNAFNKFTSTNRKVAICVIQVKCYIKSVGNIKIMCSVY